MRMKKSNCGWDRGEKMSGRCLCVYVFIYLFMNRKDVDHVNCFDCGSSETTHPNYWVLHEFCTS